MRTAPSPVDRARAARLLYLACGRDQPTACDRFGNLYEQGRGVQGDLERARELYRRACSLGDAPGCEDADRLTQAR